MRRCWLCPVILLLACGPEQSDGGQSGSGTDTSGSEDSTEAEPDTSLSAEEATSIGSSSEETGLPENACAPDEDLHRGDCASQGDTCLESDWECRCVCGCEGGDPGEPGHWQCYYDRFDEIVTATDLTITIDCAADTITGSGIFAFDNGNARDSVELTMGNSVFYYLGAEEVLCRGTCQSSPCPDELVLDLEAGETQDVSREFSLGPCLDDEPQPVLCDFCGDEARINMGFDARALGFYDNQWLSFESVPIVCE